jgi:glycerol uptake facilitator-like aquaporin
MKKENIRKYIAEFLGTMLLSLGVLSISLSNLGALISVFAGLFLTVLVYVFGGISGAHLNPAITVGILSTRKIKVLDGLTYIFVQCLGALAAFLLAAYFQDLSYTSNLDFTLKVTIAELAGTFVLALGVGTVVFGKVSEKLSGVIIGLSLMLGIIIASLGGAGALNPAVALGNSVLSISNIVGPLLGGVLGMWVAKLLNEK